MNYYTSGQSLSHIESELHRLQGEMLEKRRERKYDEVENLEYLIDQLHLKFSNLKNQVQTYWHFLVRKQQIYAFGGIVVNDNNQETHVDIFYRQWGLPPTYTFRDRLLFRIQ